MQRCMYVAAIVAAVTFSATASKAVTVDIPGITSGSLGTGTLNVAAGTNTVTFTAMNSGKNLRRDIGLGGLLGNGLCGDGTNGLGGNKACGGAMSISFANPVDDLSVSQTGLSLLSSTDIVIMYSGGTDSGKVNDLLNPFINILGSRTFDFADYVGITSVSFDTGALVTTGLYYGDVSFNEQASPVPLPAALPLMLVGMGGLAFVSRRRKGSAPKA